MRLRLHLFILLLLCAHYGFGQDVTWQQEYQGILNGEESCVYSGGFSYPKPVLVDIDADGDLDLFVGSRWTNGIFFIRNDGTPEKPLWVFVSRSVFGFEIRYSTPAFCDIDGDGDLDAFTGEWAGKIRFIRNTGTATSPAWTLETESFESINLESSHTIPTFCDIDADGDSDLFIGTSTGHISFYRNTGTPSTYAFTLEDSSFAMGIDGTYCLPSFYDIDNDGDQDLFVGTMQRIYFYRNDGTAQNGLWNLVSDKYGEISLMTYGKVALGDLDNDNDADMIVGESSYSLRYYENTGTQSNAAWKLVTEKYMTIDVGYPCHPALTDIDADNDLDLLVGHFYSGLYLFINDGTAQEPAWLFTDNVYLDNSISPTFCDINGDGDQDIFVGQRDGTIHFIENIGTAENALWAAKVENYGSIVASSFLATPAFCDIDNDNDFDLFVGTEDGDVLMYENTGSATDPVWPALESDVVTIASSLWSRLTPTFTDIDKDGDQDLFFGATNGRIAYYRNDGTPEDPDFVEVTIHYGNIDLYSETRPVFGDIDADGDEDLFVGEPAGGLCFWRNMGFTDVEERIQSDLPRDFALVQNFPNPFNPVTTIRFHVREDCRVELKIIDMGGREVTTLINEFYTAGKHQVIFDGRELPSGLYFTRIQMKDFVGIRKMILTK